MSGVNRIYNSTNHFHVLISPVLAGDTSQILVMFFQHEQYLPSSLTVTFVTSFLTSTGAPRVITTTVCRLLYHHNQGHIKKYYGLSYIITWYDGYIDLNTQGFQLIFL